MLYNWGDFLKNFLQSVGRFSRSAVFIDWLWYNRCTSRSRFSDRYLIVWQKLYCFIKSTPSSDGHSGPRTVFYIKGTGPYQPVAPFYYVPFSGLQTTPTGLRREIPMELWCYIGRASSGTVCLALTDTKQWVLFLFANPAPGVVEYILEVVS